MQYYVHYYKPVHYIRQKIAIVNARVLILMINSPANLNFQLNCQSPQYPQNIHYSRIRRHNVDRFIKLNVGRFLLASRVKQTNLAPHPEKKNPQCE